MPDFMNPSADLQAGIAAGWAEGQRQIENMQDEIEHLEKELDEQRARAQRLESTLVLTEDQRDKASKERDDWLAALKREQAKHFETLNAAIAERDELRTALEAQKAETQRWQAHSVLVEDQRDKGFAERDALIIAAMDAVHKGIAAYNAAIAERNDARTMCKNQAETWLNALAESTAKLKTVIAERDALRKQLDDIRHDYTDKSYWGNT